MTADTAPENEIHESLFFPSRREWIGASIAIALQSALFLAPALLTSKVLLPVDLLALYVPWATGLSSIPHNANLSDSLQQFYPYLHFFRDQVHHGHFPLWNPYVLGGTPFLANSVSAVLFPLTWLVLLLPAQLFFEWSAFLKLFLAGLGVYLYARASLQAHPLTAWCSAASYAFCGYNIYFLGFPNTYVTMLLPWGLLALDRGFLYGCRRARWVFSLLVGALLVAGHIESAALALLFFLLYAVVLVRDSGPGLMQRPPVGVKHSLLPLVFHLGWGIVLASAGLIPFVFYLQESATWANRTQAVNPFHISLSRLPAMWIPYFFGSPIFNPNQATVAQMEQCIFVGAIPLLLALYGMSRTLNWRAPALIAGLLAGFLITFGIWPFFELFTSLPLLRQGNHIHAVQIFQLCAVLLAALGLERWRKSAPRLRLLPLAFLTLQAALMLWQWRLFPRFPFLTFQAAIPWYAILALLFLLLFCATQIDPGLAPALAAVLLPALGFLYGFCFNPAESPHLLEPQSVLQRIAPGTRLAGIGDGTLLPNMSMTAELRDLRGYESVVLSRTQHFFDRLTGKVNDPQHSIPQVDRSIVEVLKQCGVQYLVSPAPLLLPDWTMIGQAGMFLYKANEKVPRALLMDTARVSGPDESLRALLSAETATTLFIESGAAAPSGQDGPVRSDRGPIAAPAPGDVVLLEETPDRARYRIHARSPGFLLLRDTYDTGWGARIDGREAKLLRANYLFMALQVPEGTSVVELTYRPWSWIAGLSLSLLAIPAIAGGIFFGGWKKNRRSID